MGKFMHAARTQIQSMNVDLGDVHGTDTPGTLGLNVPVAAQGVQGFPYGRHLVRSLSASPRLLRSMLRRSTDATCSQLSKMLPGAAGPDLTEEGYRREMCTTAAALVDQYCVGAPDDRGVSSVQPWLMVRPSHPAERSRVTPREEEQ